MEPLHTLEYEMTSEFATEIQRTLSRWELRRGWRKDARVLFGAIGFTAVIVSLGLSGLILPGVAGGLLCLVAIIFFIVVYYRWSVSSGAAFVAMLALQSSDRRVRIEFFEERLRMETEFFRGDGAWTELNEVIISPTFWVLYLTNGGQVLIPTPRMTSELDAFIRAKAEAMDAPVHQI